MQLWKAKGIFILAESPGSTARPEISGNYPSLPVRKFSGGNQSIDSHQFSSVSWSSLILPYNVVTLVLHSKESQSGTSTNCLTCRGLWGTDDTLGTRPSYLNPCSISNCNSIRRIWQTATTSAYRHGNARDVSVVAYVSASSAILCPVFTEWRIGDETEWRISNETCLSTEKGEQSDEKWTGARYSSQVM